MDRRLLRYYDLELQHLRGMGAEFAREFPKIAQRLGLEGFTCADPFVERLLEGVAFLTARVQLKLDAEFPRFTQSLLETIYPHYLAPTPSMTMVQLQPELAEAALGTGVVIPRDTSLRSQIGKGDQTACEYRTGHAVTLWPIQVTEVKYYTRELASLDIPAAALAGAKAGIRIRLQSTANLNFNQTKLDDLVFYLNGTPDVQMRLYEQIVAHTTGVVAQGLGRPARWREVITTRPPESPIKLVGFADNEALLPYGPRSFQGYRLVHEYFAFPQRFMMVRLTGLKAAALKCADNQMDVVILLKQADLKLENALEPLNFALNCTPAVNLFSKRTDRINLSEKFSEFQVIPDRTRPLDFEVYQVRSVTGYGAKPEDQQDFSPFYRARDLEEGRAYYTINRVPRVASSREQRFGARSRYPGTEIFLSLVDAKALPYRSELRTLSVDTLCTNRDLPLTVPIGRGTSDFSMEAGAPVVSVKSISGQPTPPRPSYAEGEMAWRIISHLSLNYLSLMDSDESQGAAALRDLLRLYSDATDAAVRKQIEGVKSVTHKPIIRRVGTPGPIAFARGLEVTVTMDEAAFEGTGVFLLGAVLDHFFAKYVAINSFTETVIRTVERGEVMRWPARIGLRHNL